MLQTPAEQAAEWWKPMRPPLVRTVSEWAAAERMLSSEGGSAAPGQWRNEVTPHLVEPMNRLSVGDPCQFVVLCLASQIGKSETALNACGYWATDAPFPIFYVLPKESTYKEVSRTRIAPMIEASPSLSQIFAPVKGRSRASSLSVRDFAGGSLMMGSAESPSDLASKSIRYLVLDEVDRYPASAGAEGDPVDLAIQRTVSFPRRKVLLTSTPTVPDGRIWKAYLATGQRRFHIPCPHCGVAEPWEREMLRWEPGRPQTAALYCSSCGVAIDERDKRDLLPLGVWKPDRPELEDGETYGYRTTALVAPYGWTPVSWRALAKRWEATEGNPLTRQVLVNVAFATPYDAALEGVIEPGAVAARAEPYAAEVPAGVALLTAGVDVQHDRIEVTVYGWSADECWLIEHRILVGDPTDPRLWQDLDDMLGESWQHESGRAMPITATCVDSGYKADTVQTWCWERRGRRIRAVKGASTSKSTDTTRPVWPRRGSRTKKGSTARVYVLGVSAAKDEIWGWVHREEPGPGFLHTPSNTHPPDADWFEQLLGEKPKVVAGRNIWEKVRARNEALDLLVYAYAALLSLGPRKRTVAAMRRRIASLPQHEAPLPVVMADDESAPSAPTPPKPPATRPPKRKRRADGLWLDRKGWAR